MTALKVIRTVWLNIKQKEGGYITLNPASISYLKTVAGGTEIGAVGGFVFVSDQSDMAIVEALREIENEDADEEDSRLAQPTRRRGGNEPTIPEAGASRVAEGGAAKLNFERQQSLDILALKCGRHDRPALVLEGGSRRHARGRCYDEGFLQRGRRQRRRKEMTA